MSTKFYIFGSCVSRDGFELQDKNGNYDFECLEAIDVEQFNHDMCALLEGKEVELPSFLTEYPVTTWNFHLCDVEDCAY